MAKNSQPTTNNINTNGAPTVNAAANAAANASADPGARRFEELVANAMLARSEMMRQLLDPRRSIDDECGYPGGYPRGEDYQLLFDREPIPNRVVSVLPKESWQVQPTVYEDDDSETITDFEQAWDELGSALRGEASYYRDEGSNPVWEYLLRVDVLSGIGQFGILLLGVDDDRPLDRPLEGVEEDFFGNDGDPKAGPPADPVGYASIGSVAGMGSSPLPTGGPPGHGPNGPIPYEWPHVYGGSYGTDAQYFRGLGLGGASPAVGGGRGGPNEAPPRGAERKLLFLRALPESLVQITQFETNPKSPRFGQPVMYLVTLNDPRLQQNGAGLPLTTVNVHWTRVIHVADNLDSSEILGKPRMLPVYNRLLDLRKLYAGSAEMYWRGAFPGYVLSTHPQLGGDVAVNQDKVRDDMEKYMTGLQRYMLLMGMSMTGLAPQVVDPTAQINVQIEAICVQIGVPVRVFRGSERGELASSQDDAAWNDRLKFRQQFYITPRIIIPFIDRLIAAGVLPRPKKKEEPPADTDGMMNHDGEAGDELGLEPGAEGNETDGAGADGAGAGDAADETSPPSPGPPSPSTPSRRRIPAPSVNAGTPFPPRKTAVDERSPEDGRVPPSNGDRPPTGRIGAGTTVPKAKPTPTNRVPTSPVRSSLPKQAGENEAKPGYKVSWPDLTSTSDAEKAAILAQRTAAYAQYIASGMEALVAPIDYLVNFDGLEEAQAKVILETADQEAAAKQAEEAAMGLGAGGSMPQGIDPETGEPMVDDAGNPLDQDGNPLPPAGTSGPPGAPPGLGGGPPNGPPGAGGPPVPPGSPGGGAVPPQFQRPGQPPRAGAVAPNRPPSPRPGAPKKRPVPPQFQK